MEKTILLQPIARDPTNQTTTYQFIRTDNKIIVLPSPKFEIIENDDDTSENTVTQFVVFQSENDEEIVETIPLSNFSHKNNEDEEEHEEVVTVIGEVEDSNDIENESQIQNVYLPQEPVPKDAIPDENNEPPPRDLMEKVLNQLNQDQINRMNQDFGSDDPIRVSQRNLSEDSHWYFSEEIRTDFVVTYLQTNYNTRETIRIVKARHPEITHRSISRNTPRVLLKKFLSKHTVANQQPVANKNRQKTKITPHVIEQIKQIAKVQSKLPPTAPRDTARRNSLGLSPSTYTRAIRAAGVASGTRTSLRKRGKAPADEKTVIYSSSVQEGQVNDQEMRIIHVNIEPKDWTEIKKEKQVEKEKLVKEAKATNQYYVEWTDKIERLESRLALERNKNIKLQKEISSRDSEIEMLKKQSEEIAALRRIVEKQKQLLEQLSSSGEQKIEVYVEGENQDISMAKQ